MTQHRDMMADAMQLHEEFPIETTFFIDFMDAIIHAIKTNFNYNQQKWDREKQLFDFSVWAEYVDTINERIRNNKAVLKRDAKTFARLLFYDGNRVFTLQCLFTLAQAIPENDRFNNKIIELFG